MSLGERWHVFDPSWDANRHVWTVVISKKAAPFPLQGEHAERGKCVENAQVKADYLNHLEDAREGLISGPLRSMVTQGMLDELQSVHEALNAAAELLDSALAVLAPPCGEDGAAVAYGRVRDALAALGEFAEAQQ